MKKAINLLLILLPFSVLAQVTISTVYFEKETIVEYRTAPVEFYKRIAENSVEQSNMYIPLEQTFPKDAIVAYIDGVFVQYNIVGKDIVIVDTSCKYYSINFNLQKVTLIESNDIWIRPTDVEEKIQSKIQ